jgi:hypothetical protein
VEQQQVQGLVPTITIRQESAKVEPPKQEILKPVPTFDVTKGGVPQQQQQPPKQEAPKQAAPKPEAPKKPEQQKYATCAEATHKVAGYTFVNDALQQCPELLALQSDASVTKTFFVPSDKVCWPTAW